MDKKSQILVVLGLAVTLILLFIDIYAAGIVFVLVITVGMSLQIMQDTTGIPEVVATLREDAKAILLTNTGNARAVHLHAALVPVNIEFDLASLDKESTYEYPMPVMVEEVKVVLTFENENGRSFSGSSKLSSLGEVPDLLKPMFPIFKWK